MKQSLSIRTETVLDMATTNTTMAGQVCKTPERTPTPRSRILTDRANDNSCDSRFQQQQRRETNPRKSSPSLAQSSSSLDNHTRNSALHHLPRASSARQPSLRKSPSISSAKLIRKFKVNLGISSTSSGTKSQRHRSRQPSPELMRTSESIVGNKKTSMISTTTATTPSTSSVVTTTPGSLDDNIRHPMRRVQEREDCINPMSRILWSSTEDDEDLVCFDATLAKDGGSESSMLNNKNDTITTHPHMPPPPPKRMVPSSPNLLWQHPIGFQVVSPARQHQHVPASTTVTTSSPSLIARPTPIRPLLLA